MPASNSGKVRIIGGRWKRTNIPVLNADGLRPTGDRQRETLFNWLSFLLGGFEGRSALDMFGGSGALSFEFLSRDGAGLFYAKPTGAQRSSSSKRPKNSMLKD